MGLVTDVVASGNVMEAVDELLAHFQTLNAEGLAATKKSLIELPDYPRADRMHEGISRVVAWQLR
jgi:enoyl-CoA hydratase/carnithine racemase